MNVKICPDCGEKIEIVSGYDGRSFTAETWLCNKCNLKRLNKLFNVKQNINHNSNLEK